MSDKISDERLKRVREILEWFKGDYDPVDDQENFEAMRDAMGAIDELLAHRSAEVELVKLQFSQEVPSCKDDRFGVAWDSGGRPV